MRIKSTEACVFRSQQTHKPAAGFATGSLMMTHLRAPRGAAARALHYRLRMMTSASCSGRAKVKERARANAKEWASKMAESEQQAPICILMTG